nr:lateral signaling target protein 2 homolog [Leptinotarsa decemlineata]
MMESIRKWLYKPKKDDKSLLAQFFYADEDLNIVANELDSFDGRKDPERCTTLVNQLRQAQDKVLTITNSIMDVLIGDERADRDFRVKFPEDVLQDNLAGQLWFGAECLAAGSSIMNRESESTVMRPLAKAVTKSLENVRNLLRDACLRNNTPNGPIKLDSNELVTEMLLESLKIFDRLFAEFELAYVSAMVPVKSTLEYELQELIGVLFSETLQRALKMKLLTQEMVDDCDPALMFTIPRLAIVSGLLIFPNGPLFIDKPVEEMSEMFRPFRTLLHKIRELLWILNKRELYMLEKLLCDNEQISDLKSVSNVGVDSNLDDFINQFYTDYHLCEDSFLNSVSTSANNVGSASKQESVQKSPQRNYANIIDIPSTSGHLIPKTVFHHTIIAASSVSPSHRIRHESPPDHDSLEVISVAAATLSSILTTTDVLSNQKESKPTTQLEDLESPNDSGICTETTSLDRSPSLELNESKKCNCSSNFASATCPCKKSAPQRPVIVVKNSLRAKSCHSPGTSNSSSFSMNKKKMNDRAASGITDEDSPSSESSETSSFHSICADDEEIALAMQAAELASRNEVRAKFRSSEDLLHRLFVCIAGVADQLQTNFACDLRNILKSVFLINTSSPESAKTLESPSLDVSIEYHPPEGDVIENHEFSVDPNILAQEALFDTNVFFHLDSEECPSEYSNHPRQLQSDERSLSSLSSDLNRYASLREDIANLATSIISQANETNGSREQYEEHDFSRPPVWIPDVEAPKCMSCGANFTVVKRRHHCRNCGKVFCARCSSNSVPLPKFGHIKPVRVCNKCFIYNLTPFTM